MSQRITLKNSLWRNIRVVKRRCKVLIVVIYIQYRICSYFEEKKGREEKTKTVQVSNCQRKRSKTEVRLNGAE